MKIEEAVFGAWIKERHPVSRPRKIIGREQDGIRIYLVTETRDGRKSRVNIKNIGRYDKVGPA